MRDPQHEMSTPPHDVHRAEPVPGVVVLGVTGTVRRSLVRLAEQCLDTPPGVLVLDLSRATTCDDRGAEALTEVRARALARGVPVELVVANYQVARALRFSEPDALLGAWPALEPVLTAVTPPHHDDTNGRSR